MSKRPKSKNSSTYIIVLALTVLVLAMAVYKIVVNSYSPSPYSASTIYSPAANDSITQIDKDMNDIQTNVDQLTVPQ